MDDSPVAVGRAHAERLLPAIGGQLGLLGSSMAYQQVWARDSMICGHGLWLCDNAEGRAIHFRSLETLRRFQSLLGQIPHNVGNTNVADAALIAHGRLLEIHEAMDRVDLFASDSVAQERVDVFNAEEGWPTLA